MAGLLDANGYEPFSTVVGYSLLLLYWGTPLLLGVVVIVSAAIDSRGVGSVLAVGWAVLTLYVVSLSIYTLIYPPAGGGIFFGHIFSSLAVLPLIVLVLLRRILNRLFGQLWHHIGRLVS